MFEWLIKSTDYGLLRGRKTGVGVERIFDCLSEYDCEDICAEFAPNYSPNHGEKGGSAVSGARANGEK